MKAASFKCQDKEKMSAAAGLHNTPSQHFFEIVNFCNFEGVCNIW